MRQTAFSFAAGLLVGWVFVATGSTGLAQEKPAEAKSSPEAARIYQDAASAQNGMAFEIAEESWRKLLKDFPKDPLAPKAQHYLGVCLLQQKKLDDAVAAFTTVVKNHPKFEFLEDSLLNLASTQYTLAAAGKKDLYPAAADSFAALIKQFPKGKFIEEALYLQGESLYAQDTPEKKTAAVASYEQLVKDHSKAARRADALYALGFTLEELGKYPEAGTNFDLFLKEFPDHALKTEVQMHKGETVFHAGDYAAAEKLFAAVASVKGFAAADHAVLRQAECLAKQKKLAEAGAAFARIPTDFPTSAYKADATLAAGKSFYAADKLTEAAPWLEKAVAAKDARSPEAAHLLCRTLIRTKKPAEAADLAAAQIKAGGDSPFLVDLALDQADALYDIPEKRAQSLPLYVKLATADPPPKVAPLARYYAAFTALDLKQDDEALKHAEAFIAAYPQDDLLAEVKYIAAESNRRLGKLPEAEKGFADLVAAHADKGEIDLWRLRLGLVLNQQKKYAETVAALTPLVAKFKKPEATAEAQFRLAAAQFALDKPAEAEKAAAASLAASKTWDFADEALLILARAQAAQGQKDEARENFKKLIADYTESKSLAEAHYRIGEIAYGAGDFKAAAGEYDTVIDKWVESLFGPYALYGKGWSQLKLKEYAPAVESFTTLLTKFPDHQLKADGLLGRAMSRRQAGDAKAAVADLDDYLKTNPDQAHKSDALYEKGLAQVALNDFAGTIATLDDLLKADSKYAAADKVLYEIGWAYKSQEKHAEAVPVFAKLATDHADSPLAPEAWYHVAEDKYEKKDYAGAAKAYASAKAKAPAGELVEKTDYKLGWSHYQLKEYDKALAQFSDQLTAYGSGPLAADATFMKAECLFRLENYKEAWPAYQAALKTKASTPAIEVLTLLHGGQSAGQLKEWDEALKLLTTIPAKFAESPLVAEALYEVGYAQEQSGKTDEALKSYEEAATKSRDQVGARARFMMGEVYFGQKKYDDAAREFQRAMFGFGGEAATPETKNWQAKSGYEAGRCAEVQIAAAKDAAAKQKLIADAKRFYTYVSEKHASHELAAEAAKRLAALGKL